MSAKAKITIGIVLSALLACGWVQRSMLQKAHAESQSLQASLERRSPGAPVTVEANREENERLREATRDLPRLRNEVRQLREQKKELDRLEAENQRLSTRLIAASEGSQRPLPTPEQGFLLRETWANAGFATPEATVQTFFWAAGRQDAAAIASSMTKDMARSSRLIDRNGQVRVEAMEHFRQFGAVQALRIAEVQHTGGDQVRVSLQAAVNGETISIAVQRVGDEWKIVGF